MRASFGRARTHAVIAVAMLACAVDRGPVRWDPPSAAARDSVPEATATPDVTSGRVAAACPRSVRRAADGAGRVYAAWWAPRPDSTAGLWLARSDDGGHHWRRPMEVDTADRGATGCNRPAPAVAASTRSGYVSVAYWLRPPEGAGVFFAHSMDHAGDHGELFHAPVAIVYGDRPSATSVAVQGDTVVVAYEDPNTARPQIALAISRTDGHIFEQRILVSSENVSATAPAVALRGRRVAVSWTETVGVPGAATPGVRVTRVGTFQ